MNEIPDVDFAKAALASLRAQLAERDEPDCGA